MFKRTVRAFLSLCLIGDAIAGSPRFDAVYQQQRYIRHASCDSCHRERPDALVSWIAPGRRSYRDLALEPDAWQDGQPSRTFPPYYAAMRDDNQYDRAFGSREAPGGVGGPGRTCKREDSFVYDGDVNPDVAPAQATTVHGVTGPVNQYKPQLNVPRTPVRAQYKKTDEPSTPIRYSNYASTGEDSFMETVKIVNPPSNAPDQKIRLIYKGDRYVPESAADEDQGYRQYPKIEVSQKTGPPIVQMQTKGDFMYYQRQKPEEPSVVFVPEYRHNPHNLSPDLNVYKMMQNLERGGVEVAPPFNATRWQDQQQYQPERMEYQTFGQLQVKEEPRSNAASMRYQSKGYLEEPPRQDEVSKSSTQIAEPDFFLTEEVFAYTTSPPTEQVTAPAPVIMQIPRKVSVAA